jgi:hypothetical protein
MTELDEGCVASRSQVGSCFWLELAARETRTPVGRIRLGLPSRASPLHSKNPEKGILAQRTRDRARDLPFSV